MNFVSLIGKLKGVDDNHYRYLEVARPDSATTAENLLIPCKYWTLDNSNLLTSLKEGTMLVIRGRIEQDSTIGVFVLVENVTVVK